MIKDYYMNLHLSTESGWLTLFDSPMDDNGDYGKYFFRCRFQVDPDDVMQTAEEAEEIVRALDIIAEYCRVTGRSHNQKPDFSIVANAANGAALPEFALDDDAKARALAVWETTFGSDGSAEIMGYPLHGKPCARWAIVYAQRYCVVTKLQAPLCIRYQELYRFLRYYLISRLGEDHRFLDLDDETLVYDRDERSYGEFESKDLQEVYYLMHKDRSVLPQDTFGYVMLANRIRSFNRLDIVRHYEKLKQVVDGLLENFDRDERVFLRQRYGLEDGHRMTYEEIAAKGFGDPAFLEVWEKELISRLRHPTRSRRLLEIYE